MADPLPATVPSPVQPGAQQAWYAPTVRDQYTIDPAVVATVRDGDDGFEYGTRGPPRSQRTRIALKRVESYFDPVDIDRPRTREGTIDRVEAGLSPTYRRAVDRLTETTPAQRRRLGYHLTATIQGLGALTPLALDEKIRIADASDERVVVHTEDFAPARTDVSADVPSLDRFLSERLDQYTVPVFDDEIRVTVYRERVLGEDVFETKYHVHAPARLPGDGDIVTAVEKQIRDESVGGRVRDRTAYVRERARTLIEQRLQSVSTQSAFEGLQRRVSSLLAILGLGTPPVRAGDLDQRIDDLVSVVLRDLVGEDRLTVPIRDPHLERVEANRVGERVKVVPRPGAFAFDDRMPTTTTLDDERRFVTLTRRLAAAGGVELGDHTPQATVTIEPGGCGPIDCSVALPSASASGPYVSIDKRGTHPVTAIDIVEAGMVAPELVSLLWLAIEHRQAIAFVGPERARPARLVEAHAPFVPFGDRPVTITGGTRSISLPHETGIAFQATATEQDPDRTAPSHRAADLAPDVTIMTDVEDGASYGHLQDALSAGRGLLASATARSTRSFARQADRNGIPFETLSGLDLVVELDSSERVGEVAAIELLLDSDDDRGRNLAGPTGTLRSMRVDGENIPGDSAMEPVLDTLAETTAQSRSDVIADHQRRLRYVKYLQSADVDGPEELFSFLADLQTDEAATVERIRQVVDG
jgi:type IV secretory pathway ATPase VirB11/archaellum biosynthesis ATPase